MAVRNQQQLLYDAQKACPEGRTFERIDDVQDYVDEFNSRPWRLINYPRVNRVEVCMITKGRTRRGVGGWRESRGCGQIDLRFPAMQRTVLHELAHVYAEQMHGPSAHGPHFCRIYLEIVCLEMGSIAYLQLRESMIRYGVEHDPERPLAA